MPHDAQSPPTFVERRMAALACFCDRHGLTIFLIGLVLCVVSVMVTVKGLGFEADRNALIGSQQPYYQEYMRYKREFPAEDDFVIIVTSSEPKINREVVNRIGSILRADPEHFTDVHEKVDLGFIRERLLLYMSVNDLKELRKQLSDVMPFLRRLLEDPGIVPLFSSINTEIQTFINREIAAAMSGPTPQPRREPPPDAPDIAGSLPMLSIIVSDMAAAVSGRFTYRSPWARLFGGGDPQMQEIPKEFYLESQEGRMYLVLVKPRLAAEGGKFDLADILTVLRAKVKDVQAAYPGVEIGVTGEPVLETDEMQASESDSLRATLVSLVGVLILFVITFGNLTRPSLAMVSLILAMGWTMGYTTLTIGHLNIITVTCLPMLIGLGIDFGIQVISRYEEERLHGFPPVEAMARTLSGTGASIVTAGFTTSVSFASAYLTGFKGIGELGILTGGGLLLSALAMLLVLPALVLFTEQRQMARGRLSEVRPSPLAGLAGVENAMLAHPWAVLTMGLLFTWICIRTAFTLDPLTPRVGFDENLLHLQSRGVGSVEWIRRLDESGGNSVLFAAVVANNVDEARRLEARLKRVPVVKDVESAVPLFPENQEAKLKLIPAIQKELATLPPLKEPLGQVDVRALERVMSQLESIFFLVYPEARRAGEMTIARSIRSFVLSTDTLLERMVAQKPAMSAARLYEYQGAFFHDLTDKLSLIKGPGPVKPLTVASLPGFMRKQLIGTSGKYLLRVFPRENIWDGPARARFIEQVNRAYDDGVREEIRRGASAKREWGVTGSPIMMDQATRLLRESYEQAGRYAFGAIVVLVFLHFLSLRATLLALMPLLLGLIWMLGVMALYNIPFNPANYLVLPLILGIGVANGIYIVRRFQEEGSPAVFSVSTGRAILLSNLTAMIGFASLMIAKYQGIMTLGLVMTIGIGTCVLASLIMLPVTLQILKGWGVKV
ncbi:MAG: hypothetical protein FJX76_13320 [Armatimonadetes bacterium]|nr:hypothetical protein [Armatimonadota bacterium]